MHRTDTQTLVGIHIEEGPSRTGSHTRHICLQLAVGIGTDTDTGLQTVIRVQQLRIAGTHTQTTSGRRVGPLLHRGERTSSSTTPSILRVSIIVVGDADEVTHPLVRVRPIDPDLSRTDIDADPSQIPFVPRLEITREEAST